MARGRDAAPCCGLGLSLAGRGLSNFTWSKIKESGVGKRQISIRQGEERVEDRVLGHRGAQSFRSF